MDNGGNQAATLRHRVARLLAQTILVSLSLLTVAVIVSSAWAMVNSQEAVDIAVDSVSVPSGPVALGDTLTLTVTVGNSTSSAASSVDVVLNALTSGGDPANIGMQNVSVGANSTKEVPFEWDTTGTEPGNYTFQAVALLDGTGNDADPSNNFKLTTTPLAIVSPPAKDVAVTGVDVPAGPVTQGDQVSVAVTVENLGTDAASSVSVTLLDTLDMTLADQKTVASIAAGASSDVTLSWDTSSASAGDHTLKAAAILDGDENNGNDSLDADTPITVKARPAKDVAVTAISLPAGPVDQGDVVDVQVTVENKGAEAVSITLQVVDTRSLTQEVEKVIEDMGSGESVTETIPWDTSGATSGEHMVRVSAIVDGEETARLGDNSLVSVTSISVMSDLLPLSHRLTLGDGTRLDASFGRQLESFKVETDPEPLTKIVTLGNGAIAMSELSPPVVATSLVPLESLFAANSQATFGSGFDLQNPFELGHIRGVIRLEERESSMGAHVIVGGQTFFAREGGAFDATVPMGNYDVEIRAPGYVSVRVTGIRLGVGGEVTIPELTLPFGDANGDGRIDIFDLGIAAGNFGATAKEYSLP